MCGFDDDATPGTWAQKFAFIAFTDAGADQGVTVAGGDVDGDGQDEIVPGQRGSQLQDLDGDGTPETPGSLICIWDRSNNWTTWVKKILPYIDGDAVDVNVALGNFDGDAALEIAAAQRDGTGSSAMVRLYDEPGALGTLLDTLAGLQPGEDPTCGVNVATAL